MEIVCDLLRTKGEHYAVFHFDMPLIHEYKLISVLFFLQIYLFLRSVVKKFLATTDGRQKWQQHVFFRVRLVSNRSSSFNNGIDSAFWALKSIFAHISVKWHFCRHFVHNTTYNYIDCYSLVYSLAEQSRHIWWFCYSSIDPTIEFLRKSQ